VEVIFGLPGDGINGFMEALRKRKDRIRFILVRHEESAAFMACAYAKYTGKLGACVAMSGPGAIHLLTGLYEPMPQRWTWSLSPTLLSRLQRGSRTPEG
jgi:pyruvate dehydrogenase (quinone)